MEKNQANQAKEQQSDVANKPASTKPRQPRQNKSNNRKAQQNKQQANQNKTDDKATNTNSGEKKNYSKKRKPNNRAKTQTNKTNSAWINELKKAHTINEKSNYKLINVNEICDLILFLFSKKSNLLNGQTLRIDGNVLKSI